MSTLLVVNPNATSVNPRTVGAVVESLAALGEVRVRYTRARGEAIDFAAEASSDGTSAVVGLGGDGTANELANGLLSNGPRATLPAFAMLPGGHTNVFARQLGLPNDPVEAVAPVLDALRGNRFRSVRVGRADDRYFLFSAGMGLDAEVLQRVEQQRAQGARASLPLYVASTLVAHVTSAPFGRPQIRITFDDRPPMDDVFTAIVQNAPVWTYFATLPITFAPDTEDGLAVYGLRSLDPLRLSNHLALATLRPDRLDPESSATGLTSCTLEAQAPMPFQVDGDVIGTPTTVRLAAVPDALRVAAG